MRVEPAEVRRDDDEGDEIERDSAERVRKRLRRRPDRHEDVEQPEARGRGEQQDHRMRERRGKAEVPEPVVEGEQLDVQTRKLAARVVPDRQQQAEQNLRGENADRDQTDDRGDVYRSGHR